MNIKPCFRCGNTDINLFSKINNTYYCRRCIDFNKPPLKISRHINPQKIIPNLKYKLSYQQLKLANIVNNAKKEIYVSAVTGSGKTEVTLKSIVTALAKGYRVGFIIPRKAIVIEIAARLRKIFPTLKIVEVYQGSKYDFEGDIIVLTAHQSYRYINKFGLVIVDEYDAFPLVDNQVLKDIINNTCYGKKIYLSATFKNQDLENKPVGYLNSRYHNYPLPQIIFKQLSFFRSLFFLIALSKNRSLGKVIVYYPTIKDLVIVHRFLKHFINNIIVIHSKIKDVNNEVKKLSSLNNFFVFSTILLERGVTLIGVNVYVIKANHELFSFANLVQIAGRVGRVRTHPFGEVIFFGNKKTQAIDQAIKHIDTINQKMHHLPKSSKSKFKQLTK